MSEDQLHTITYMLDTETGFTYTCLKGEVAGRIKAYPVQKEITETEYNSLREIIEEPKVSKTEIADDSKTENKNPKFS
jgi:hypothetical protein